jgi:hypothetical protein
MKYLKLKVSNSDIKNGERSNPQNCAIAKSLKRSKNIKASNVSVFHNVCIIKKVKNGKTQTYRAHLPQSAQDFVSKFDHGFAVNPFSLSLELVKVSKKQAYKSLY